MFILVRKPLAISMKHPQCLLLKKKSVAIVSIFGEAVWFWQKQDWKKVMEALGPEMKQIYVVFALCVQYVLS